jgi:hypothetical protein
MIFQTGSKKLRILLSVGMASLAIGLFLLVCIHPLTVIGKNWRDGIAGLFMGMALGLDMGSVLLARRLTSCNKA